MRERQARGRPGWFSPLESVRVQPTESSPEFGGPTEAPPRANPERRQDCLAVIRTPQVRPKKESTLSPVAPRVPSLAPSQERTTPVLRRGFLPGAESCHCSIPHAGSMERPSLAHATYRIASSRGKTATSRSLSGLQGTSRCLAAEPCERTRLARSSKEKDSQTHESLEGNPGAPTPRHSAVSDRLKHFMKAASLRAKNLTITSNTCRSTTTLSRRRETKGKGW
jgi:hypothetical protein